MILHWIEFFAPFGIGFVDFLHDMLTFLELAMWGSRVVASRLRFNLPFTMHRLLLEGYDRTRS
mgnify:CR=1 FL=1